MKQTDNGNVCYAIFMQGGSVELFSQDETKLRWPEMLLKFLLERTKFTVVNCVPYDPAAIIETNGIVFIDTNLPTRILGCTDEGGIQFWCQFQNDEKKLLPVTLTEKSEPFQRLVLDYLESNISTDESTNGSNVAKMNQHTVYSAYYSECHNYCFYTCCYLCRTKTQFFAYSHSS